MRFVELKEAVGGHNCGVFDAADYVGGICAKGCATYTRKQLDELTDFVKRPQVGAKGLVYIRCEAGGTFKSSIDKFYSQDDLRAIAALLQAEPGDLILILAGPMRKTQKALCELRLEMGGRLGLRPHDVYAPLWVIDFPLLEWDDETQRSYAMHHPFTSPNPDDIPLLDTDPGAVRATAYDMVVNGIELGGGSIRIHERELQQRMFKLLGFTPEQAEAQFGFLMSAFQYGAPPHGGLARAGPLRVAFCRTGQHPRLHRFPEEQLRARRDVRCPVAARPVAARRTEHRLGGTQEVTFPLWKCKHRNRAAPPSQRGCGAALAVYCLQPMKRFLQSLLLLLPWCVVATGQGEVVTLRAHYGLLTAGYARLTTTAEPGDSLMHTRLEFKTTGAADQLLRFVYAFDSHYEPAECYPTAFSYDFFGTAGALERHGALLSRSALPGHGQAWPPRFRRAATRFPLGHSPLAHDGLAGLPSGRLARAGAGIPRTGIFPLRVHYRGRGQVTVRGEEHDCIRLDLTSEAGKLFFSDAAVRIYLSDDARRIPIRLSIDVFIGTFKLDLAAYEPAKGDAVPAQIPSL